MAPASQSQDPEDEGFNMLLKPIQDIARNWDVDLSKHIEMYLHHIYTLFGDKITDMNFAEAAVLVQNSANIYGKKVDVLFETVVKLLHCVTRKQGDRKSKDDAEEEGAAEQPTAGRRRKANPSLETEEFLMFDEVCSDRDLTINIEKERQKNLDKKRDKILLNASTKGKAKEKTSCSILNFNEEVMGRKEEFRLNWRICSKGTLHEEIVVNKNMFRVLEPLEITIYNGDDEVASDHNLDYSHHNGDIDHEDEPPLLNGSLFSTETVEVDDNKEPNLQVRKPPLNIVDHREIEWQPNDFNVDIFEKPIKKKNVVKKPPRLKDENKRKTIYDTSTYNVTNVIISSLGGDLKFLIDKDFSQPSNTLLKSKRDLFRNFLNTVDDDLPGFECDDDNGFEGFDDVPSGEDNGYDSGNAPEIEVPLPEGGNILASQENNNWNAYDPNTYDNEARRTMEEFRNRKIDDLGKKTELSKRVKEWHQRILPKLEAAEQRSSFDINEYGTKVLDSFTEGIGSGKLFQEIVQGQPREEVSRYFLSSLMLANQYNVEISQTDNNELSKDCMHLKLLSLVRHHEELDDNMRQTSDK